MSKPKATLDWLKEVSTICKTMFCHFISKWGGVKCEDYRMSTILAATFVMSFILGGGISAGFAYIPTVVHIAWDRFYPNKTMASVESNTASADTTFGRKVRSPESLISADAKKCDMQSAEWKLWLGELNTDVQDHSQYFLPIKSSTGLFNYTGSIPETSICEFAFVPRGEKAMNYVISFDGNFQIVVGDNDYRTVSLSASNTVDGPYLPVADDRDNRTRPHLNLPVKKGSLVKIRVVQSITDDGKYKVEAQTQYSPESAGTNTIGVDVISWTFRPSPSIDLREPQVSIGLIRAKEDKSEVSANFVTPSPVSERGIQP